MKNLMIFTALFIFCMSCERDDSNIDNLGVERFFQQIKNGTYNEYELGENGEKLWTVMPNFKKENIYLLLTLANDTSLVCPCDHFPINPISSIPPYRKYGNQTCIMMGEYLLWCVQAIIEGKTFASLIPILAKKESTMEKENLSGREILHLRRIYIEWWEEYSNTGDWERLPLDDTNYRWR